LSPLIVTFTVWCGSAAAWGRRLGWAMLTSIFFMVAGRPGMPVKAGPEKLIFQRDVGAGKFTFV